MYLISHLSEPFEDCDDGNVFDGDGCSRDCTYEEHFRCRGRYACFMIILFRFLGCYCQVMFLSFNVSSFCISYNFSSIQVGEIWVYGLSI